MPPAATPNEAIQRLVNGGLLDRLPASFTAYFAERIQDWPTLFPPERRYITTLFAKFEEATDPQIREFFQDLLAIEKKMGVSGKVWDGRSFNLDHVDFLNRSPHYDEWREEIRRLFSLLDPALEAELVATRRPSVVLTLAPEALPMGPDRMWRRFEGKGRRLRLAGFKSEDYVPRLLSGSEAQPQDALPARYASTSFSSAFDCWLIEAGSELERYASSDAVYLSYSGLDRYRRRLMDEVSSILNRRKPPGPRELAAALKELQIPTGDKRIDGHEELKEFARAVFLSGNGTLLINNTFVEWAAAQAARRARPQVTVIQFGIRNKLKPFSSLLIFEDQDEANVVPSQEDVLGSWVDLEIFYQYIVTSFQKYPEYRRDTVFLFGGKHLDQMLTLAPDGFYEGLDDTGDVSLEDVYQACWRWLNREPVRR